MSVINKVQVSKEHYDFCRYVHLKRWNSYYHQIESTLYLCQNGGWNDILLIWVWDWIVVDMLKRNGLNVTTFDFDKNLNPDIVWDVTKIDEIVSKKYDVVVCCEVLEHIPFEMFETTIKKLSKTTNNMVLSLPKNDDENIIEKLVLNQGEN